MINVAGSDYTVEVGMSLSIECIGADIPFDGFIIDMSESNLSFCRNTTLELPIIDSGTEVKLKIQVADNKIVQYHGTMLSSTPRRWDIGNVSSWDGWERREYFRHRLDASAVVVRLDKDNEPELRMACKLLDISAVGLKFSSPEADYLVDDIVKIDWVKDVPTGNAFKFKCQIVRKSSNHIGYFYGCKFIDMSDKDQDKLVHALFCMQQLERRTKVR